MLSHIIRSCEMRWLNNIIARFLYSLLFSALASSFHSPFKPGTFHVRIKQIKRPSLPEKPFLVIDSPQSLWIESTHVAYGSSGQKSGTTTSTINFMEETHQWIQEPNQHFVTKCLYLTSLHRHIVYT